MRFFSNILAFSEYLNFKANTFWAKAEIRFSVLSPKRQGPSELQGILNCIYCTGSADWLSHPSRGLKMFWTKYWFIGISMWFWSVSRPINCSINFSISLGTSMWFWSVSWLTNCQVNSLFFGQTKRKLSSLRDRTILPCQLSLFSIVNYLITG